MGRTSKRRGLPGQGDSELRASLAAMVATWGIARTVRELASVMRCEAGCADPMLAGRLASTCVALGYIVEVVEGLGVDRPRAANS